MTQGRKSLKCCLLYAGIAQLVERNLAKVEVASSRLVSRSRFKNGEGNRFPRFSFSHPDGALAKWLCSGLQSRLRRFDSGTRLQSIKKSRASSGFFYSRKSSPIQDRQTSSGLQIRCRIAIIRIENQFPARRSHACSERGSQHVPESFAHLYVSAPESTVRQSRRFPIRPLSRLPRTVSALETSLQHNSQFKQFLRNSNGRQESPRYW